MAELAQIGLEPWRSMLRGMWDAKPGTRAALALVVLVHETAKAAMQMRDQLVVRRPILLLNREFGEASKAMQALVARIDVYADAVGRAQRGEIDDAGLHAWVAAPVLEGVWPADFPPLHQITGSGDPIYYDTVTARTSSATPPSWVGDGQLAAYAYNKMVAGAEAGLAEDPGLLASITGVDTGVAVQSWIDRTKRKLGVEGAGDAVAAALEAAYDKAAELLEKAGSAVLSILGWAALGIGLTVGGYFVVSKVMSK